MQHPEISIIIPVLNEQLMLDDLLHHLNHVGLEPSVIETLVVDGGSTDNTVETAKRHGVRVLTSKKGRAKQMNLGANHAKGRILYFLHADTFPPKNFDKTIKEMVKRGHNSGCFRMRFDSKNPVLRFFAWCTRLNHIVCRGGDQSLFVTKDVFSKLEGFNEAYRIYEDSDFIRRLYSKTNFKVIKEEVLTSARRYREKGWLKVQYHFAMIHLKNYMGYGPDELYSYYVKKLL